MSHPEATPAHVSVAPGTQIAMPLEPGRHHGGSLAAPAGPDYQDLRHMGMWVEGVQAGRATAATERLLVARNKTSGRRWIVDPITGIGQPEDASDRPPVDDSTLLPPETLRSSGGPFPCEHCGKCKMLVLRLPDRSVMKKCLACRRFVVDGRVERAPRVRSTSGSRTKSRGRSPEAALSYEDGEGAASRRRRAGRRPSTPPSLPLGAGI